MKEPVFLDVLGLLTDGLVTLLGVEPSFRRVVESLPELGVPVPPLKVPVRSEVVGFLSFDTSVVGVVVLPPPVL